MKGEMFMKNNKKRTIIIIATTILAITFAVIVFSNCSLKTAREEKEILNNYVSEETVNTDKNDTDAENNTEVDTAKAVGEVNVTEASTVIDNASLSKPAAPNAANNAKNNTNNANSKNKVPTTAKNSNQSTPPSATVVQETQKRIPLGSNKDIDPEHIKQYALKYMSTLDGVHVCPKLNRGNSCWTGYDGTYHFTSDEFEERMIESIKWQYDENVDSGNVGCGKPFGMYIEYEKIPRDDIENGLCYYRFYVLYTNSCCIEMP